MSGIFIIPTMGALSLILSVYIPDFHPANKKTHANQQKATGQRELKLPVTFPGLLNSRAPQSLHLTRSEEKMPTYIFQFIVY